MCLSVTKRDILPRLKECYMVIVDCHRWSHKIVWLTSATTSLFHIVLSHLINSETMKLEILSLLFAWIITQIQTRLVILDRHYHLFYFLCTVFFSFTTIFCYVSAYCIILAPDSCFNDLYALANSLLARALQFFFLYVVGEYEWLYINFFRVKVTAY